VQERSLELKVGILVLSALIILLVFIFAMGGINLEKTYTLFVDFDSPGWLSPGAMVKVSGVEAGKVEAITFMGGEYDPIVKHRVYVRLELDIKQKFQKAIHKDAEFFVASQGVLGEQYVEIVPGTYEKPYLEDGEVVIGITPPKLEVALAKGYVILDVMHEILTENRGAIDNMVLSLSGILDTTNTTLKDHKTDISQIITNLRDTTQETKDLVKGARASYVDNPKVNHILANVESITKKVDKDIGPIMSSTKKTVEGTGEIFDKIDDKDVEGLKSGLRHLSYAAVKADDILGKVQKIVDRVERGEGNVGALLKDEELFDDLREMVRDLKHNPWKMFWKD
jgi:phospholipid/cholesterol/gamma-HCH transport system substrate-binding protein